MPRGIPVPDAEIERAADLIRGGATVAAAATQLGLTVDALSKRLWKRGIRVADLRPVDFSRPGRYPVRYPCRYCGECVVVTEGGACHKPACRAKRRADRLHEDPTLAEHERERQRYREEKDRRQAGSPEENEHLPRGQRRPGIWTYLSPEQKEALQAAARARGLTMSHLIVESLQELGLIRD